MTVKKCTKKHDPHAKFIFLLIKAYFLFAIFVAIFIIAYCSLKDVQTLGIIWYSAHSALGKVLNYDF